MWDEYLERFAAQGHRCVALPLPSYPVGDEDGDGNRARDPVETRRRPDFNDAVREVAAAIECHGPGGGTTSTSNESIMDGGESGARASSKSKVVLVCHDWGCIVGLRLWRARADLIDRIVLLDVVGQCKLNLA